MIEQERIEHERWNEEVAQALFQVKRVERPWGCYRRSDWVVFLSPDFVDGALAVGATGLSPENKQGLEQLIGIWGPADHFVATLFEKWLGAAIVRQFVFPRREPPEIVAAFAALQD